MPRDRLQLERRRARIGEMLLWIAAALLISGRFWVDLFGYGLTGRATISEIFGVRYQDVLVAIFFTFFPLLVFQVLGNLPFEALRQRTLRRSVDLRDERISELRRDTARLDEKTPSELDGVLLARSLAESSREMADKIYIRSGVYLIVGVLVAFSGLAFFYAQTPQKQMKWDALLLALAPRFGILFFIELVAFFFLRQYREAMDEFRYFEAIKRKREESLLLLSLARTSTSPIDLLQLIEVWDLSSTPRPLSGGQTTEVLETRKLTKDELSIFEKMLDVMSAAKSRHK
jgi:hypothetical protein